MRKSLLLLCTFASLTAFAGLALPAVAASQGGASATQPADPAAIDLSQIPVKMVTGRQAVQGVALDDEDDDIATIGKAGKRETHGAREAHESREGHGEADD